MRFSDAQVSLTIDGRIGAGENAEALFFLLCVGKAPSVMWGSGLLRSASRVARNQITHDL